jgi:hypothetical protein
MAANVTARLPLPCLPTPRGERTASMIQASLDVERSEVFVMSVLDS